MKSRRAQNGRDLSRPKFYPRFAESIPRRIPITITVPVEVKTALTPFPAGAHSHVIIIARIEVSTLREFSAVTTIMLPRARGL